jgi:ribosome-associated protein
MNDSVRIHPALIRRRKDRFRIASEAGLFEPNLKRGLRRRATNRPLVLKLLCDSAYLFAVLPTFGGVWCSGSKGTTLRTALRKKADMPSPVAVSRNDEASRAIKTVLASLEDSKAENIVSIDIQGKSSLGDYMVVASGRSHRHVSAVADHLIKAIKDAGLGQARVEGLAGADWVLIDSGDVIVHVFRPEIREFYNIEKLWQAPDLEEETIH